MLCRWSLRGKGRFGGHSEVGELLQKHTGQGRVMWEMAAALCVYGHLGQAFHPAFCRISLHGAFWQPGLLPSAPDKSNQIWPSWLANLGQLWCPGSCQGKWGEEWLPFPPLLAASPLILGSGTIAMSNGLTAPTPYPASGSWSPPLHQVSKVCLHMSRVNGDCLVIVPWHPIVAVPSPSLLCYHWIIFSSSFSLLDASAKLLS